MECLLLLGTYVCRARGWEISVGISCVMGFVEKIVVRDGLSVLLHLEYFWGYLWMGFFLGGSGFLGRGGLMG